MFKQEAIIIDGVKWWVTTDNQGKRSSQPICPLHNLRLRPVEDLFSNKYNFYLQSRSLKCHECKDLYRIPISYQQEILHIFDKLDSKIFAKMKFINLDDEALPIAEHKISKDSKYFVTSVLTESKVGKRLVVYAGERGSDKKAQIFVEPEIKRLAFDQKDLHPSDVFTTLEATFEDGTKSMIKKGGEA